MLPLIGALYLIFSSSLLAQPTNDENTAKLGVSSSTQPSAANRTPSDSEAKISAQESSSAIAADDSSSKPHPIPIWSSQPVLRPTSNHIQWKTALIQTVELTGFQHVWRAAWDPGLRYLLAHKPFWYDYGVSLTDYHMDHWSDGDSFVVNDVGHPLNGAVYGRVLLQNYPKSFVRIGRHNGYWTTRMQSFAWMMLWSTQFEVGPLSEPPSAVRAAFTTATVVAHQRPALLPRPVFRRR